MGSTHFVCFVSVDGVPAAMEKKQRFSLFAETSQTAAIFLAV
jgi:hypothetical protein